MAWKVWSRAHFRPAPRLAAGIAALVMACGGGERAPDFEVRGTRVVIDSPAPFTHRADFPARVESTLEAALTYWGGSWSDLEGKTVVFAGGQHVPCTGTSDAIGCYEAGQIRISTRDVGFTYLCVEETVLVHEVGHSVIGDPDHVDVRWRDFAAVARDLEGRPGYDGSGEVPCLISVNVWKQSATVPAR